ncbi:TPA: Gfo/Idh/MocA family oxidoreductase, partial [Candidatus Bathyarchaeota archaeon]|nr:Gfo/Idh/MocA family oxidoreductase [Candidatus Bathyarchaeota archaeon]
MTLNRLKVGMIGCGGIAKVHVARLSALEEVELTAFCDIADERARAFSQRYGGNVYADWHEMFDREKLDIVYICLPPFAHEDEVTIAAEKGVHVFIEKPIALSMDLAKRMVRAVERHGVKSQVGYQCRFGLGVERAKQLIQSGEAGDVGLALGLYWCNYLGGAWWRDKRRSGGQMVEQATHVYDALRYLCGEVDRVHGEMNRKFWVEVPDLTIEDVSGLAFRFKSGAVGAIVSTTWGVPGRWWLRWLIAARRYTLESPDVNSLTLYT